MIRKGPSTCYTAVGSMPCGSIVSGYETPTGFLKLEDNDSYNGYYSSLDYLKKIYYKPVKLKITTSSANLNIRKAPGTQFTILGSIPKGAVVFSSYYTPGWRFVTFNNMMGWISDQYCTIVSW